ncbi:NAD(P)-dependent oxidoreductase [Halovulum dunhuangense]|uniref:NAD(P)-dependent oxidoreductase n=1 Tax=Halovulum dunhuangense TaxID=1505036 RepID=A0A849L6E2_9RHOB|nr:DUF1932 domain-containing protein [Halovulum dunhuangense]NNU81714.1 NAD(P)-dependent oxidoreductase [Halovulum dunhuangense]
MRIAFIGFGEAARAFHDTLVKVDGGLSFAAYDLKDTADMAEAMAARGVARGASPAEAIAGADWIVSAVTADQSLAAATSAAAHLGRGQVFIDINSVSPGRKRESAAAVEGAGAAYVDMAVMAPVHPRGHATPVLVAGPTAAALALELERLGFSFDIAGDAPGAATAIKMVRSLFVKGLEAITVEALLAAQASGCFEEVLASLSKSYPGLGWPQIADYHFERTLRHGVRRAAEMRESAATLDALGLTGGLAREIAAVQERMGAVGVGALGTGTLSGDVAEVLKARLG